MPQATSFHICPPFLPEAPHPIIFCSNKITLSPFLADSIAVDNPVKPPPITHKSHEYSSLSVDDEVFDLSKLAA